jgi:Virulence protein RhuM family/P22_AR N-terminal domain
LKKQRLFRNSTLNANIAIKKDGDTYIAMKPIVEGIGLEWSGQHKKLSDKKKFSCVDIYTTGKDNKQYQMLCIPLKKLNGYLFSINHERVRRDIKNKVILYQEECFTALYSHFTDGYSINEKILANQPNKIMELARRLRQLRSGEQSMYANVREVFKETAIDYDSGSKTAKSFFAMAQDKFHYAVTQKVDAEIVLERADSRKENMGMTNTNKGYPTKPEARIGKNYLTEDELFLLENISEQFLLFAETKAFRGQKMTMEELSFNLS